MGLSTGFSSGELREAAVKTGKHRPPLVGDGVDWDLVEKRRIEFNWLFDGDMVPATAAHAAIAGARRGVRLFS